MSFCNDDKIVSRIHVLNRDNDQNFHLCPVITISACILNILDEEPVIHHNKRNDLAYINLLLTKIIIQDYR